MKRSKYYNHIKQQTSNTKSVLVTSIKIILFFILLTLTRLGQIPLNITTRLIKLAKNTHLPRFPAFQHPNFLTFHHRTKKKQIKHSSGLPLFRFIRSLLVFRTHRPGRPRQKPWLKFQLQKIKKFIYHLVPKKLRFKVALVVIILGIISYSALLSRVITELPSPNQITSTQRPLTTQILDRNGKLLYQFYEGRNRTLVKLNDLPPYLIQATIAVEDKHFYQHKGLDFLGIARALKVNLSQEELEGGSTITQQLIKNTLLTPDQTLSRKVKEAFLALWAEWIYSKEEILQMYFNEAPYGGPAWGIEAASRMYFGKSAHELTLSESAYLAGLPAAPTEYSPYGTHPEKGRQRQAKVLKRMVEDGYLTQSQADEALNQELAFKSPLLDIQAPHFVMYVRSLLAQKFGERTVSQGGLKVITTLDLNTQKIAEEVVVQEIEKLANLKVTNGAAMVTDPKTGEILAMVGSKDYFDPKDGNFNVTLALRQPGSSIKPITYAAGFLKGFGPSSILLDTPTTFPGNPPYSPVNYDGRFHGPVTARVALGSSYNIPAVKMLASVGVPDVVTLAKDMGITTFKSPEEYGLSLTLGGGAVRMIDMMGVYGAFANQGIKNEPQALLKVTDTYGNVLIDKYTTEKKQQKKQVITPEVAFLISHILADNGARTPAFGPNSLLKISDHTVAVKTGTSDDKRDNWTFGYTPTLVVGVWVGNNDYSPMDPTLTSGITGAAPIWHNIISSLLQNSPDLAFQKPAGVTEAMITGKKELVVAGQNPKSITGFKKAKQKKKDEDKEEEIITYSDPYSVFIPETKTTQ